MNRKLSRRVIAQVSAGSLAIGETTSSAHAQTPESIPELDRYSDLMERLAATDPQTTLDLLLETPFDEPWLVPLASNPPFRPEAYDMSGDETFDTEMIGAVILAHPDRDVALGLFLVFPDETLASEAMELTLTGTSPGDMTVERLTIAGLDAAMGLFGERYANVLVQADYIVILGGDDLLGDGALTNSFAAQIRALQHALGLIWHVYGTLRR